MKDLLRLAAEMNSTKKAIFEWCSRRTLEEEFTPLHLAAFKNNLEVIRSLLMHGADPREKNRFGLSVMHAAAQGDSAAALYFFKIHGSDINELDQSGSTPLHWACYSGSEVATLFLLAWKPNVSARDSNGQTPLHLAVKEADKLGSVSIVRHLLLSEANP